VEGIMATFTDSFLRSELEERRNRLAAARNNSPRPPAVTALLQEVDAALSKMEDGTYGICDVCHDPIETKHLLADPLSRFCIDHMTQDERRALENDLELAAQVQRALLPARTVREEGWHIHYHYEPAGAVSGDYCDIIRPELGSFVFLLGDVSGKGIAASLLMSHLHAMFRAMAGQNGDMGALMGLANHAFCSSAPAGHFATLICGRLGKDGEIQMSSAGHLPALAAQGNGIQSIFSTGVPLGIFGNSRYPSTRVRLQQGETLVLFTDGLSEAQNQSGDEYGLERIQTVLKQHIGAPPESLAQAFLQDVRRFSSSARQSDDLTLMVIQRAR
jgi:sigma-B regulation protein RsbU (phosphoserine phosphatase)